MKWMDNLIEKWYRFVDKVSPFCDGVKSVFRGIASVLSKLWKYAFWFRSVVLGAPLATVAVILAAQNSNRLPDVLQITRVTIDLGAEEALFGFFVLIQQYVSREVAVTVPLIATSACIVLMLFSKRVLYPFMIGLLTLILPPVLYYFTVFPM